MKHMEEEIKRRVEFWKSHPQYKQTGIASLAHTLITEMKIEDLGYFSVGWMARKMEISESYLSSCFKKLFRRPPSKVMMYYKIRLAKELLLRRTDLSISQIAEKLDFSCSGYFIRVFKKQCNITPLQYRKKSGKIEMPIRHNF